MGLKIGDLARATGTKVETVRYYERIGLLPPAERTSANYRSYMLSYVDRLSFIRHARGLGFDIADIRSLLAMDRSSVADAVRWGRAWQPRVCHRGAPARTL